MRLIAMFFAATLLAACATIESDSALNSARQAVERAEASQLSSRPELDTARNYLRQTEAAFNGNEPDAYASSAQLTTAYADLALTRGELEAIRAGTDNMTAALTEANEQARACRADLEQARSQLQQCQARDFGDVAGLAAALGAFEMRETSEGVVFSLRNIDFAFESAGLPAASRERLGALADYLAKHPEMIVRVTGHTDTSGPTAYNQRLSERRAKAVADLMTSKGVAATRVSSEGRGESQPVESNDTRAGRIANRRVEVTLTRPGARLDG